MKNRFFKYCLFLILLLWKYTGFSQSEEKEISYPQIDTILVSSEPDYPPYCFVDENGNAAGLSIDLFNAVAAEVNLEAKIEIGIWNQIKQDLANGKIDALPMVGRTPEREELFDFTIPYITLHGAVFVRKGTDNIHSFADLKGKEIVVMKGDNAEEFLRRYAVSDKIVTTNTFEEAFKELAEGNFDAVVTQRLMGILLLHDLGINSIKPLDFMIPEFEQEFCFAVQKGNKELLDLLNEGLSVVIANNTYEEIRNEWLGRYDSEIAEKKVWRTTLFITVPILLVMILLWIVVLRNQVHARTQRLTDEMNEHKTTLAKLKQQHKLQQESEEQIRLLLDSTAEGIYAIDMSGSCIMINRAALELLGYSSSKHVIGRNMNELLQYTKIKNKRQKESCEILQALANGKGIHQNDAIIKRKDGSEFSAELFSFPIRKEENITGAVVTFLNIEQRKKAEKDLIEFKNNLEKKIAERTRELEEKVQKLRRSEQAMLYMVEDLNKITAELKDERQKLKQSNEEMEAFTYSVSHDLRAPLRAINGYSKFLKEDYISVLDEEGIRFVDTICENAIKMDRLIIDLLNLSRVTRTNLHLAEADIKLLSDSMYQEIASEEEKEQFELKITDMPKVICDSRLMKQALQNLIGNALKYSSKSEIKKIEIDAKEHEEEVEFWVKDYGAGFNPKYTDKLFGLFQRLHKEEEFAGTGVGLAIVQRIISRQGGRVWAEGETGKGAVFFFTLPKAKNNEEQISLQKESYYGNNRSS